MRSILAYLLLCVLLPCGRLHSQIQTIRYLALGDSYTIGESVKENDRWPNQLASLMNSEKVIVEPTIIAKTGWRTDNLLAAIKEEELSEDYDLVSLLIGVNNQYQGRPFNQYEAELIDLISISIDLAGGDTDKVFMVSIPDYYYTPFGQNNRTNLVSRAIDRYNAYAEGVCDSLNITFIDITEISRKGIREPRLVAKDDLHPSGFQYKLWSDLIYDQIQSMK